jgi:hypothetical protein
MFSHNVLLSVWLERAYGFLHIYNLRFSASHCNKKKQHVLILKNQFLFPHDTLGHFLRRSSRRVFPGRAVQRLSRGRIFTADQSHAPV